MVILFSTSLQDKIKLATLYQPPVGWDSKFITVLTAFACSPGWYLPQHFHREKDWSQVWVSASPAPLKCPQAPSLSPENPGKAAATLPHPTGPSSTQTRPWEEHTLAAASMCREGSQVASKPQAGPDSLTRHRTDERQVPPKWQVQWNLFVPNYFLNKSGVTLSWLVHISSLMGNQQGTRFGKNVLKHRMCHFIYLGIPSSLKLQFSHMKISIFNSFFLLSPLHFRCTSFQDKCGPPKSSPTLSMNQTFGYKKFKLCHAKRNTTKQSLLLNTLPNTSTPSSCQSSFLLPFRGNFPLLSTYKSLHLRFNPALPQYSNQLFS